MLSELAKGGMRWDGIALVGAIVRLRERAAAVGAGLFWSDVGLLADAKDGASLRLGE